MSGASEKLGITAASPQHNPRIEIQQLDTTTIWNQYCSRGRLWWEFKKKNVYDNPTLLVRTSGRNVRRDTHYTNQFFATFVKRQRLGQILIQQWGATRERQTRWRHLALAIMSVFDGRDAVPDEFTHLLATRTYFRQKIWGTGVTWVIGT